jgi:putative NADH-flavin reductase
MRIALFGATGRTGRRVLDECLGRGWSVVALARDPSQVATAPGVTALGGDARDAATVARVVAGADAVVCCLGMQDITVPATDFSDSVKTIVACAKNAGVRRIVAIASAVVLPHPAGGLRLDHGLPEYLVNIGPEHRRNYETLRDSGLDWTLMCPLDLKDDIPAGRARLGYDDLPGGSFETGYADLARTIVQVIDQPASFGRRVGVVSTR